MLNKEFVYRFYIVITLLAIAWGATYSMSIQDGEIANSQSYIYILITLLLLIGFPVYLQYCFRNFMIENPIKWFSVLFVWMALVTIISSASIRSAITYCILLSIIPGMSLICMFTYAAKYGLNSPTYWTIITAFLMVSMKYLYIYIGANEVNEAHLITSYYSLCLLPLILILPNRLIRYVSIFIVTASIFLSLKRGGLVALVLGLLVYTICAYIVNNKGIKSFLYVIFTLVLLGVMFFSIAISDYGGVVERILSIQDDEGSGRVEVWDITSRMIQQSEYISYIFGHGADSVLRNSPIFLSAHNDFLEAWYDYGLVGFSLYIFALFSSIRYVVKLIHAKSSIAPSMAMLLSIVLVLTMISHVLIYYLMTLVCISLGLMIGIESYNRKFNEYL